MTGELFRILSHRDLKIRFENLVNHSIFTGIRITQSSIHRFANELSIILYR